MPPSARESLTSKVIVRFRHKAGKNGQLFPQTSWISGFLITSTTGLVLASGPNHIVIPYSSILSIEDEGMFPLQDGPSEKLIPLVFSSGLDFHVTLIGVPPLLKNILTKKIYTCIISSFRGVYILTDGVEVPFKLNLLDGVVRIESLLTESFDLRPEDLRGIERSKIDSGSMITIHTESMDDIHLVLKGPTGEWLVKMLGFISNEYEPDLDDKHREVLKMVSERPVTTTELTERLQLVQLEGSTILNEMLFLDLVTLDHDTKHYIATSRGQSVLQSFG